MKLALALGLLGVAASAQEATNVSLSNGVQIDVSADMGHPTGQQRLTVEMARASGDSFYRIFRDQNNLMVFAYELEVDLASSGKSLTATAKPAENEFAARYPNGDGGKPVPSLSSDHVLGPLNGGEAAKLGLFEIPGMGLQVSDTVRVKMEEGGSGSLRFAGLRVFEGGKLISGPPPPASVSGKFVMFYIPGRGGFFFASGPVAGRPFVNAGTVDQNRMRFAVENVDYECTASSAILPGASSGQVWVYHDPSFTPEGNWTQDPASPAGTEAYFTAASDSLGWWLR